MIPLATTTITVTREEGIVDVDPYDPNPPAPTTVAAGIRAAISAPTANVALSGGDRVVYTASLRCDPCDITNDDVLTDGTGTVWSVLWARRETAAGLDFILGQLRLVQGAT